MAKRKFLKDADLMMAIIAMNAWNRVGITTERKPEPTGQLI